MTSLLFAGLAALGMYLVLSDENPGRAARNRRSAWRWARPGRRAREVLEQTGLVEVSPLQFAVSSVVVGMAAVVPASLLFGPGVPALLIAASAAGSPAAAWRRRRERGRRVARDAWPRLIEEVRVLTGSGGRSIPQALLDVGLRGPEEMRPAFEAAQREWALTTDFERTTLVLKQRLADPTADATCETLLVAAEVGGDLDRRLRALAEDRRQDLLGRKEAQARQAGARLARTFVVIVPAGMALAGLNVGDGAASYRTAQGQVLVAVGIGLVVVCWVWASRIMRLPEPERVLDR
jgi:tight adherence protein B